MMVFISSNLSLYLTEFLITIGELLLEVYSGLHCQKLYYNLLIKNKNNSDECSLYLSS